jgi:hypothetical protein
MTEDMDLRGVSCADLRRRIHELADANRALRQLVDVLERRNTALETAYQHVARRAFTGWSRHA